VQPRRSGCLRRFSVPLRPKPQILQISQSWTYSGGDPTIEWVADNQNQVTETDENNNIFSATLLSIVDNTAPMLTGTTPTNGAVLQQIEQISVSLADSQSVVDDAAVIDSFSVTNGSQQPVAGTISESADVFSFVPDSLPLSDETYQVSLTAVDTHGNSQSYSSTFTIDTQPPAKPLITGGTVASGTIQARPVHNTADQFTVELIGTRDADTRLWVNGQIAVDFGGSDWSTLVNLEPGQNTFELWLRDRAGNQGESEWVDIEAITAVQTNYEYDDTGRVWKIHSDE
jgi:hypothetical protein